MNRLALLLILAAPLACSHARQVADTENPEPGAGPPHDEGTVPRVERAGQTPRSSPAKNDAQKVDEAENQPPPLATSPAGLLEPGAVKRIQEQLHDQGFLPKEARSGRLDGPTRKALRELQSKHNLPATGTPDDVTLQKLGLDAKELFRSARTSE